MQRRSTSIGEKVKISQNAGKQHEWPEDALEASEADLSMYRTLQAQRAYDDWRDGDLEALAFLAKLKTDLYEQYQLLREEGVISYGGKSGMVPMTNPRAKAVATLATQVNAAARVLSLNSSTQTEKRAIGNRNTMESRAREAFSKDTKRSTSGVDLM